MKRYIIFCFVFLLLGCNNEPVQTNIPASFVFYELSLNSKEARNLLSPSGIIKINKTKNIRESLPPKGIAIVRSIEKKSEYYAFDLICSHDYPSQIELKINGIELYCPRCNSHFQVVYGDGIPIKGPATLPLRKYRVYIDNTNLIVRN